LLFYSLMRAQFRLVALPLLRFRVEGTERLPASGPGIVVALHRSWLDPACVGGACPRPVRFLILETVYRRRAARWFYRRMRSIPVAPGAGGSLSGLRTALRALREGELIGVFPEGRVFPAGRLGPFHPGAALLAIHAAAPVIPMVIRGSDRAWPHGSRWPRPARVSVRIGAPITPPAVRDRGAIDELVRRMRTDLEAMERAGSGP
jgi:1-acyl-sn-glycerol-3-phosphate acyltransferase